ncbi:MAG: nucleoside deaminase [archaeon]
MSYIAKKRFMLAAIAEAKKSAKHGEYAIGAVVVKNGRILTRSEQRRFRDKTPAAHAECLAISKACKLMNSLYLEDCILYTTHEPCCVCTGTAAWARMKGIVYGISVADMTALAKKRKKSNKVSRSFYVPCSKLLENEKPRKMFLIKEFMRKECLSLFEMYPR